MYSLPVAFFRVYSNSIVHCMRVRYERVIGPISKLISRVHIKYWAVTRDSQTPSGHIRLTQV